MLELTKDTNHTYYSRENHIFIYKCGNGTYNMEG